VADRRVGLIREKGLSQNFFQLTSLYISRLFLQVKRGFRSSRLAPYTSLWESKSTSKTMAFLWKPNAVLFWFVLFLCFCGLYTYLCSTVYRAVLPELPRKFFFSNFFLIDDWFLNCVFRNCSSSLGCERNIGGCRVCQLWS